MENETEQKTESNQEIANAEKEEQPLEEAKKVLEQLKEQNEIMSKNLERQERLATADILGGKGFAGMEKKQKTQEELNIEGAKKLIEGTGYENILGD